MTLNIINNLSALFLVSKGAFQTIQIILFACMIICAIATIIVVLFQPGNSSGSSAISGTSETFLGKSSKNTLEGKLKRLTVIALIVIIVFSVLFFLVSSEILLGVGAAVVG